MPMPSPKDEHATCPYGRCESCGYPIEMIIRRNTRFCCGRCEERGPAYQDPE